MKGDDYYVGFLYKFPASHIPQPLYISPKRRDTVDPTREAESFLTRSEYICSNVTIMDLHRHRLGHIPRSRACVILGCRCLRKLWIYSSSRVSTLAISAYICVHGGLYGFNPVGGWVDMGIVVLRWRWDRADDATDVDAKVKSEILASQ